MKIKIELDIPKETYSRITKWLASYDAEGSLKDMLQRDVESTVLKWKGKANEHFKTGLNAFERFKQRIRRGEE